MQLFLGVATPSYSYAFIIKVYRLKEALQVEDWWNIITHNAKPVTSPSEFRRCCAGDLLRDMSPTHFPLRCLMEYNGIEVCVMYFYQLS